MSRSIQEEEGKPEHSMQWKPMGERHHQCQIWKESQSEKDEQAPFDEQEAPGDWKRHVWPRYNH